MTNCLTWLEKYSKYVCACAQLNLCETDRDCGEEKKTVCFSRVPTVLVGNKKDLHMER